MSSGKRWGLFFQLTALPAKQEECYGTTVYRKPF